MSNHYTPTTQDVQWAAITTTFEDSSITEDAFNRWLDARDARITAAAEQRGAERALRDAAESKDLIDYMHTYFVESGYAPSAVRSTATYLHTRADLLEGDGE